MTEEREKPVQAWVAAYKAWVAARKAWDDADEALKAYDNEQPVEPKLSDGGRQTRTMPFRYEGVDFIVTYKIDVNGDTELLGIKSEGDLLEVLKRSVLDEADNQIRRHAEDNPKA